MRIKLENLGSRFFLSESQLAKADRPTSRPTRRAQPMSIRIAFEKYKKPILVQEGRKATTFAEYETAVRAWSRFWSDPDRDQYLIEKPSVAMTEVLGPDLVEPGIREISKADLLAFRSWYSAGDRGKRQVNKTVKNIQSIIDSAAEALDLPTSPKIKALSSTKVSKKIYVTENHLTKIFQACDVATWPTRDFDRKPLELDSPTYWRAALVLFFNYGFRTQELIAYEISHRPITRDHFSFETESPTSEIQNRDGWFWYVPQKQEGAKADPLTLPLNRAAKTQVETLLATRFSPSDPLFPFARNKKRFYETWTTIVEAAGVKPKTIDAGRRYQIKDLRKTCATFHNLHRRGIAPFVLGHASRGDRNIQITDTHYDNAELALVEAFETFPQPGVFLDG